MNGRTVTTTEELDALPEGAVIRTSGHGAWLPRVAVKTDKYASASYWAIAGEESADVTSDELDDLPATILWPKS